MSSQAAIPAGIPSILIDDGSSGGGDTPMNRTNPDRWYFSKDRLDTTPSRKSGVDADKELTYRQQSANFIQDIGQRLQVNQLCINTAIVYMHRFYMFHSFTQFHRNAISAASIFLAAKVEEQPRKLEHVIKVAHYCLHREHQPQMDSKSEQYLEQSAELVMNENILLQTLGFDVAIDHPHTHVVKCCHLVRASKDLAQTSYFMATNSLHLTTMCLQYKPTVVACVCIHLACKWSSWEIPRSKEGKDWFWYVDDMVTTELLEKLTTDFLQVFNKSPSRLKKKIISLNAASSSSLSLSNVPYHGFDSSPGQHPNQSRSRSPSPKRPASQKPNSSQSGVPAKPKPHGMPMSHHPMKMPYPPGAQGSGKHSHGSSHPQHSSSHSSSSGKPPHPGMPPTNMKDPHHPHHSQHPHKPYPPHGPGQHAPHGQYPHGARPNVQSSGSSQSHHGHGMHSKPPVPGSTSTQTQSYSSSSSSMKHMQSHNPSKPPHMPPSGGSKMPPNQQVPGAVKNPSQPMFHSSQSHVKKPYEGRPEYNVAKREGLNSGSVHHSQNHSRSHDKVMGKDGRHHSSSSGLPQSHGSTSHHSMPFMAQDMDRASSNSSSNQKLPFMESRSMESATDVNRHRSLQSADTKRNTSHGASASTNGNNNNNESIGSGAGDSHVPSKNAYRAPSSTGSTFGQNSQLDMGANKYHADGFGGEYGAYGSSSTILSIEDRRKRRHAESMAGSSSSNKRSRSENYAASSVPSLSSNSLFSPEELSESTKRLPPPSSQFSPSAGVDGTQSNYKLTERSQAAGASNDYGGSASDGIVFGSEMKSDIRRVNPSLEFQAPDLLQPINDTAVTNESLPMSGNAPRTTSLFSPEFTPGNPVPPLSISPTATDIHIKREPFLSTKSENVDQQSSSGYSEGGSQFSFTGRLSNSPKQESKDIEDSHSNKKSKKKEKKHKKDKHKEEKKHKKDKHKEKEKEKDKKDKHRSREKEKHSSIPAPEVSNDVASHKIKIKLGRDDGKGNSVQSTSRHSSSKTSNSSASTNSAAAAPVTSLKVKIGKGRVSSLDEDNFGDESTPCCPGFGPCLTCNRDTQDQYRFFTSAGAAQGLTMKIAKNKESSKSSKESSSSRDSKKSKDKEKTSKSSSSSHGNSLPGTVSNQRHSAVSAGSHHMHKNGMEKSAKKKEKSAAL